MGRFRARLVKAALAVAVCAALALPVAACVRPPSEVHFRDPALDLAVRCALTKVLSSSATAPTYSGPIHAADLEKLIWINAAVGFHCRGGESLGTVKGLSGLEYCKNLTELYLDDSRISDSGPLSGLTGLRSLEINGNRISDLSPLSNMTVMNNLSLDMKQVKDLMPLQSMSNLASLSANGNDISDISPLSSLSMLLFLHLQQNQIRDISVLNSLPRLSVIQIRDNPLDSAAEEVLQRKEELKVEVK